MHVALFTLTLIFTLTFAACSGRDAGAEPADDSPAYTRSQVQRAITDYARTHNAFAACYSSMLEYQGNGLWVCGSWTFNERSGAIVR